MKLSLRRVVGNSGCEVLTFGSLVVWVAVLNFASGSLPDVFDKCCDIGRRWFVTNRESCTAYTSPVQGIHPNDRANCNGLIQVCCLNERQQKQCTQGKQSAKVRRSCEGLESRPGSEDARVCCNCCDLGITAHEAGLTCSNFKDRFDLVCDAVFQDCCKTGRNDRLGPTSPSTSTTEEDKDLDICAKFPGQLCAHICINTPGSYECACHDGFTLHSDKRTCVQDSSTGGRCALNNPCQHHCNDSGHAIRCSCFDGYALDEDGRKCKDINECVLGNHRCTAYQRCKNTEGRYVCEGPTHGSHGCLPGFEWNQFLLMCIDVNECSDRQVCGSGQICVNNEGSYHCQGEIADQGPDDDESDTSTPSSNGHNSHLNCGTGFAYSRHSGQCEDVNECAMNLDTCVEGQTCENTVGSFMCRRTISCGTGYTLDQSSQQCLDDDECQFGTHNCGVARECVNLPGSFRCVSRTCPRGYQLDFRTGNCNPVICPRGLEADDIGNCIDIDECVERPEVCRSNQECRNSIGSYSCRNLLSCSAGYEVSEAGTRCVDIDECQTGTHECHGTLMKCINRPGSYACQCPEGYQINHALKICEDLDECAYDGQACAQDARCENTHGSFRCICRDGFTSERDGQVCNDIDECRHHGMCQHTCQNTWGSFQCLCEDGYQLASDSRTCNDVDECQQAKDSGVQVCLGLCENSHGSYTCVCPSGYQMGSDGQTCQDINECAMQTANCLHHDDVCVNTRGSYKCQRVTCPTGFVKAPLLGNRNSNVKCQRKTFICPQGDAECLYAPLSYSTNFITFPTRIRTPADLFTMRGPLSPYRRLAFDLKLISARDPKTGEVRVNRAYFAVRQMRDNEAVIQLLREIPGPQDIELQLDMNIYSKEFGNNNEEIFFGTAVARIFIYVTKEDW